MGVVKIGGVRHQIVGSTVELHAPNDSSLAAGTVAPPFIRIEGSIVRVWNLLCDITFYRTGAVDGDGNYLYQIRGAPTVTTNQNAGSVRHNPLDPPAAIEILFANRVPAEWPNAGNPAQQWSYPGHTMTSSGAINPPYFWWDDRSVTGPIEEPVGNQNYILGHYTRPMKFPEEPPYDGTEAPALTPGTNYRLKLWGSKIAPHT